MGEAVEVEVDRDQVETLFSREPAAILGVLGSAAVAGAQVAIGILGGGGFADGLQLGEGLAIAAPVLTAIGVRAKVVSPATDRQRVRRARRDR